MTQMTWTPARIEQLTTLWKANDLSAAEIAAKLGGISRSAVIGKAHRLGLAGGGSQGRATTASQDKLVPRARHARVTRPRRQTRVAAALSKWPEPDVAVPLDGQLVTLFDLDSSKCHWPIGVVGEPGFGFCGHSSLRGLSYCAHHTRLAHKVADTGDFGLAVRVQQPSLEVG